MPGSQLAAGELLAFLAAAAGIIWNARRRKPRRPRELPPGVGPQPDFAADPQLLQGKVEVCDLALCRVLLVDDAQYAGWLVLVPRRNGLVEVLDLAAEAQELLWVEVAAAMRAVRTVFSPDKLNQAAIGNLVSQLHIHVAGRRRSDPAWPGVHLGAAPPRPFSPAELGKAREQLRAALAADAAVQLQQQQQQCS